MPLVREVGDEGMQRAALFYQEGSAEWWGTEPTLHDYIAGYARRGQLMRKLSTVLEEYPTLLTPVSADEVMLQDADIQSAEGMRRCMDIQWPMMSLPLLGVPGLAVRPGWSGGCPPGSSSSGAASTTSACSTSARSSSAPAGASPRSIPPDAHAPHDEGRRTMWCDALRTVREGDLNPHALSDTGT